jgi:hypothetical protein
VVSRTLFSPLSLLSFSRSPAHLQLASVHVCSWRFVHVRVACHLSPVPDVAPMMSRAIFLLDNCIGVFKSPAHSLLCTTQQLMTPFTRLSRIRSGEQGALCSSWQASGSDRGRPRIRVNLSL